MENDELKEKPTGSTDAPATESPTDPGAARPARFAPLLWSLRGYDPIQKLTYEAMIQVAVRGGNLSDHLPPDTMTRLKVIALLRGYATWDNQEHD